MKDERFGGVNYGSIELDESPSLSPSSSPSSSHKCSVLEAASNQIAVVTGAGMLSLPFAASAVGWSVLLLLFILTIAFCYSYLLLVYSIEKVRERYQGSPVVVDYTLLGRESFGVGGDKFVLAILISELFLALVSFFINIALNLIVIFPSVEMTTAIILSALITFGLSLANMKFLSRVTGVGNIMTILTVMSLALSGIFLPPNPAPLQYKFFDPSGIAVSLGVMAYCFGGHGAFPQIYQSMGRRERVPLTISTVAIVVFVLYGSIITLGYLYYGPSTHIPVTLNIGRDLNGSELPSSRLLSVMASLGLIFNIQATCPLIVITISDMILTSLGHHSHPQNEEQERSRYKSHKSASFLLSLSALFVSIFLRSHFLQVTALIGSLATMSSSILLPIAFFHCLHPFSSLSLSRISLHLALVVLAILAMSVGFTSSLCGLTESHSFLCSLTTPANPT